MKGTYKFGQILLQYFEIQNFDRFELQTIRCCKKTVRTTNIGLVPVEPEV